MPSKDTVWQVLAQANVNGFADGVATAALHGNYTHGWKKFRLQGGLWLFYIHAPELPSALDAIPGIPEEGVLRDLLDEAESQLVSDLPEQVVVPLPHLAVWWRF